MPVRRNKARDAVLIGHHPPTRKSAERDQKGRGHQPRHDLEDGLGGVCKRDLNRVEDRMRLTLSRRATRRREPDRGRDPVRD